MAAPLLERQVLERLERLTIRWHKSFRGLVGGHNISRYGGPGQEFMDHRHFHQGDDLRAVNWRAYLRLDKLFLKIFQVEPRTPVRVLIDASSSMTVNPEKFLFARRLVAALTYIGLVRHDSILLQPFHSKLDDAHKVSGGRHRFGPASDFLSDLQSGGKTSFLEIARAIISNYSQPGLLIIVSDFLDDGDILKPLQYLADFGHELMLVHVWAPEEREPDVSGEVSLEDAESGALLNLTLDTEACHKYREAFDQYAAALEKMALRTGGRYIGFPANVSLDEAVFQALEMASPEAMRAGRAG